MSQFAACPIVELRPDPDVGLVAVVPLVEYGGDDWIAVTESLAAALTHRPTFPLFDPRQGNEDVKDLIQHASEIVRTDRKYRGRLCSTCNHTA